MVRFIILGLLNIKPMSAYEFDKLLINSIKNFYNIKQSQVYIEFKKLKSEGFLESKTTTENNRIKEIYNVTEEGKKELINLERHIDDDPEKFFDLKLMFLVRTFFGFYLPDEENLKFLFKLKEIIINKIDDIEQQAKDIENDPEKTEQYRNKWYWNQTINYGLYVWNYSLKWIDDLIIGIKNKIWENNKKTSN